MLSPIQVAVVAGALILFAIMIFYSVQLRARQRARAEAAAADDAKQSEMETTLENLVNAQHALTGRVEELASTEQSLRTSLVKTVEDSLGKMSTGVTERLSDQADKTAESLLQLRDRLNVIDEAQRNITQLSGEVVSLHDILANRQPAGAFGELQLKDIVSQALPPSAYAFQADLPGGRVADCVIKLPDPPGPIVVDAKFPIEAFHALRDAKSDEAKARAATNFKKAVLTHVLNIAQTYVAGDGVADSALMFVPSEGVYAELHANFADVVQESFRARVWMVSPTTMMATLNTVRAVLKDVRLREQAELIHTEVFKMVDDVRRLRDRVEKLQANFGEANKDLTDIMISTDRLVRKGARIQDVHAASSSDLALPAPDAAASADSDEALSPAS
ncbi:MAG: DNA recombination protein RmuC [Pseudomonadota bacterium]